MDGNNSDGRTAILRLTPEWVSSSHVMISLFARRGNGRFLKLSRLWGKRMEVNKCCSESDQTREQHHVSFAWALLCKVNDKQPYVAGARNGSMFILQFSYHIGTQSDVAWSCPCVCVPQQLSNLVKASHFTGYGRQVARVCSFSVHVNFKLKITLKWRSLYFRDEVII